MKPKRWPFLILALGLAACAPMAHDHGGTQTDAAASVPHHHHGWLGSIIHDLHEWAHSDDAQ